jgi:site-specific recombinase XerD
MIKKHTFSLLPILRLNKKNKKDEAPVYIRITVDGKRTEISTKIYVAPERWNSQKGRVKGSHETTKSLNRSIEMFEQKLKEIYTRLIEKETIINIDSIKSTFLNTEEKQRLLVDHFEFHYEQMKREIDLNYSKGTVKNWKVTLGHLRTFVQREYGATDITFKELNKQFVIDFDLFAKRYWHCGNNAALKHIQRIKKVVNDALEKNWIDKDPFLGYKGKQDKTHRTFLTKDELMAMEQTTMSIERLEKVKDVFIFSCYTGLAYVDIEKLTKENIVVGIDGQKWVYTFRSKTGNKSNIPLLPAAMAIIEKYQNYPENINKQKLLPTITNIKTNAYLKEIADLCHIKKHLTFHMARHTFATTITLNNGVPIETVSKMLGHSKITTTQIYAKVLENKVSDDMLNLKRKLYR